MNRVNLFALGLAQYLLRKELISHVWLTDSFSSQIFIVSLVSCVIVVSYFHSFSVLSKFAMAAYRLELRHRSLGFSLIKANKYTIDARFQAMWEVETPYQIFEKKGRKMEIDQYSVNWITFFYHLLLSVFCYLYFGLNYYSVYRRLRGSFKFHACILVVFFCKHVDLIWFCFAHRWFFTMWGIGEIINGAIGACWF